MTTPATLPKPLIIRQGTTFHERWMYTTSSGVPIDLTGCRARLQVRGRVTDPAALIELTTENGGITLGGAAGTIELDISEEATRIITTWKGGVWDFMLTWPNGDVECLAQGQIVVMQSVTR